VYWGNNVENVDAFSMYYTLLEKVVEKNWSLTNVAVHKG
jgi:hypothetical protein